jgi:spore maturation protein CgeB
MNNSQPSLKAFAGKPPQRPLRIVILGLAITPSSPDGHATVYRPLVKGLARRGHDVLFLEPATPPPANDTDAAPPACRVAQYNCLADLKDRHAGQVAGADAVIVGSCLEDGRDIGAWVMQNLGRRAVAAFYDIDAPATMSQLAGGNCRYVSPELIARYDACFCCSSGPLLNRIASRFGAKRVIPLHRAVDEEQYFFQPAQAKWDMAHIASHSPQRLEMLDRLMFDVARHWPLGRFMVAGTGYPRSVGWPGNVKLTTALAPAQRVESYNAQRFALSIGAAPDAQRQSVSPPASLLEAAACATPIISDWWHGINHFFEPGAEILVAVDSQQVLYYLRRLSPHYAAQIGRRARQRVLANHTANIRAAQLETYLMDILRERAPAALARQPRAREGLAGPTTFDTAA